MTPADLAELLKTTAAAVLAEHGLDAAALPATVTVERPRNPEHGDYATNLALQLAKKVGANPRELAGWLADALADADGIAVGRGRRTRASSTCASRPPPRASIVANVLAAGAGLRPLRRCSTASNINLEFVSANPTGPIHIGGTRWAAVGDALGRLLTTQGAAGGPGVLLQRPRRPDRPVRQLADRRGQGRARPRGRLRRRLHRRHRRRRSWPRRPTR